MLTRIISAISTMHQCEEYLYTLIHSVLNIFILSCFIELSTCRFCSFELFLLFCPPLSVPGSVLSRSDPSLLLQEASSQLLPGGDVTRKPGEGVLRGELLAGGGCRDLPVQREDGKDEHWGPKWGPGPHWSPLKPQTGFERGCVWCLF